MILTSVLIAINADGKSPKLIKNPSLNEFESASSVHVLAFTSQGELLVAESQGTFMMEDWDEVFETGKALCHAEHNKIAHNDMQGVEGEGDILEFVKSAMKEKVAQDLHWHT